MKTSLPLTSTVLAGVLSAMIPVVATLAAATQPAAIQVAAAELHRGEGEVTKIDEAKGKITLRHEPIPSLEWPAMQMLFGVADAGLLKGVKVGNRVRFVLQKTPDGRFVITEIKPM